MLITAAGPLQLRQGVFYHFNNTKLESQELSRAAAPGTTPTHGRVE